LPEGFRHGNDDVRLRGDSFGFGGREGQSMTRHKHGKKSVRHHVIARDVKPQHVAALIMNAVIETGAIAKRFAT
jgi:hypothetical protein